MLHLDDAFVTDVVSTHSRLEAADKAVRQKYGLTQFQHTAA